GVAHYDTENALILQVLNTLQHRMKREPVGPRCRWRAQRECERRDRVRRDTDLAGRADAIRAQPADGQTRVGLGRRVTAHAEIHLAAGDASLPGLGPGVSKVDRVRDG